MVLSCDMFCCSGKLSNLLELVSYGKFVFSRLDLNGNKPAEGKCLARKVRDREVFIL